MNSLHLQGPAHARRQQGVVLYVALVVLIAMMLAGVAMLRSVGTGVAVAGNLSFKQNALLAGDRGVEAAVPWLVAQTVGTLQSDVPAHGYFATWDEGFDPRSFDWSGAAVQEATADDGAGNRVRYVIHRMCKLPGSPLGGVGGQECSTYGDIVRVSTGAGVAPRPLFRVTSRVDGPRNTVSYVQVVVY